MNKRIQDILEAADAALREADWGGGFQTSREAQAGVQAGLKADAKKRKTMILSAMQKVIDGQMSKIAFKKLTGMSFSEMMTLPAYTKKLKMKKEEIEEAHYSKAADTPTHIFIPRKSSYDQFFAMIKNSGMMFNRIKAEEALEYVYKLMNNPKSVYFKYQTLDEMMSNSLIRYKEIMGIREANEITEAPYTPAMDYEGEMAMTQLKSVIEKANDILGMLKPEAKMEAWVQSKITIVDDYISSVRDYLKHTDGAIS